MFEYQKCSTEYSTNLVIFFYWSCREACICSLLLEWLGLMSDPVVGRWKGSLFLPYHMKIFEGRSPYCERVPFISAKNTLKYFHVKSTVFTFTCFCQFKSYSWCFFSFIWLQLVSVLFIPLRHAAKYNKSRTQFLRVGRYRGDPLMWTGNRECWRRFKSFGLRPGNMSASQHACVRLL